MSKPSESCKNHQLHLCELTSKGVHKTDPKKYHELVLNPEFVCKNCGRVAAKQNNLCSPVKLGTWEE